MRKTLIALVATLAVGACTTTEKDAVTGGLLGAGTAALLTDDPGTIVAAGAGGAVAGVLIGDATRRGYCRYRDSDGTIYEARCRRR